MRTINRSAVIIIPKQPFLDWLRNMPDPKFTTDLPTLEKLREDNVYVFLIEEYEAEERILEAVYDDFDFFFTRALWAWWTQEKEYPKNRTLEMFKAWFDVRVNSLIEDTIKIPLRHHK